MGNNLPVKNKKMSLQRHHQKVKDTSQVSNTDNVHSLTKSFLFYKQQKWFPWKRLKQQIFNLTIVIYKVLKNQLFAVQY